MFFNDYYLNIKRSCYYHQTDNFNVLSKIKKREFTNPRHQPSYIKPNDKCLSSL